MKIFHKKILIPILSNLTGVSLRGNITLMLAHTKQTYFALK